MTNKRGLTGVSILFVFATLAACGGGGGSGGASPGASSTTYIGTQSPGDVWNWTLAAATFNATNITLGYDYSGSKAALPSGFLKLTVTATTDPALTPLPANAYALELPNTVLLIKPAGSGDVIAAVAQGACPLTGVTYNWITIPSNPWNSTVNDAYGTATSASAAGLVDFALQKYLLDGTAVAPSTAPGFSCASGVFTKAGSAETIAATPSGALVGDAGPGAGGILGMVRPSVDVNLADLASRNYRGMLFKRIGGVDTTEPVGANPGIGLNAGKLVGYCFSDVEAGTLCDPVNNGLAHLDSATQPEHGLIRFNFSDPSGDHQMIAVVNQVGGKFMLFGIALNTPVGVLEPYNFMLIEQ